MVEARGSKAAFKRLLRESHQDKNKGIVIADTPTDLAPPKGKAPEAQGVRMAKDKEVAIIVLESSRGDFEKRGRKRQRTDGQKRTLCPEEWVIKFLGSLSVYNSAQLTMPGLEDLVFARDHRKVKPSEDLKTLGMRLVQLGYFVGAEERHMRRTADKIEAEREKVVAELKTTWEDLDSQQKIAADKEAEIQKVRVDLKKALKEKDLLKTSEASSQEAIQKLREELTVSKEEVAVIKDMAEIVAKGRVYQTFLAGIIKNSVATRRFGYYKEYAES